MARQHALDTIIATVDAEIAKQQDIRARLIALKVTVQHAPKTRKPRTKRGLPADDGAKL